MKPTLLRIDIFLSLSLLLLMLGAPTIVGAQPKDYGDAPEGPLAYPALNVNGAFPSCRIAGPSGFVEHGNLLGLHTFWFGPMVDLESDCNAGLPQPPYDQDECQGPPVDTDAGLGPPGAFTITPVFPFTVVPCSGSSGVALGIACQTATWGPMANVDIFVNAMGAPDTAYANVLVDWDQNGLWPGSSQCPAGAAPEHILVDWVVPPGFFGQLSMLQPPSFRIGPNVGYVWSRFTLTEQILGAGWDGTGSFEDGESEDYLLEVTGTVPAEETSWGRVKSVYHE